MNPNHAHPSRSASTARPSEPSDPAPPEATPGRQIVTLPISLLLPGESPRLEGQNEAHVARLVEVEGPLPPIVVDRRTLRVIDGTHRLMAALAKGQETIEAEFFDGSAADAFLVAVQSNVAHGFPLSQADRRSAAARIITSHPHLSDRAIAGVAGLSAKTVAAIRRSSQDSVPHVSARIGRDGRVRPLNGVEGRLRAAELIREQPQASLREVARVAGVSPATVSDVRKRLDRGEEPVSTSWAATNAADEGSGREVQETVVRAQRPARSVQGVPPDPEAVLEKLLRDPSLRQREEGRRLLRILRENTMDGREWLQLTAVVPAHCADLVAQLARHYARLWTAFAQRLEERPPQVSNGTTGG